MQQFFWVGWGGWRGGGGGGRVQRECIMVDSKTVSNIDISCLTYSSIDKLKGTLLETPSPKTKQAEKENQGDKGINMIIIT